MTSFSYTILFFFFDNLSIFHLKPRSDILNIKEKQIKMLNKNAN